MTLVGKAKTLASVAELPSDSFAKGLDTKSQAPYISNIRFEGNQMANRIKYMQEPGAKRSTKANPLGVIYGDIVTMPGYTGTYVVCRVKGEIAEQAGYDFYAAPVGDYARGFHQPLASVSEIVGHDSEWVYYGG